MSGGLLGFGDPNADKKMADDYGVTPEMLSAQRMSSLGNIGAILLAAAQPGPIGQRGQILAGLANVSGNAAAGLKDAVAARMNGIKLKEAQQDLARKAQVRDMVSKMDLTPEQKAWATANPDQFLQSRGQAALNTQQAVDQAKALQPLQLDYAKQLGGVQTDNAIRQETALAPVRTDAAVKQAQALAPIQLDHAKQLAIVQAQAPVQAKIDALKQSGLDEATASGLATGRLIHGPTEDEQGNKGVGIYDLGAGGKQINAAPRAALNPDQATIVSAMPTAGANGKPLDYSEATGGAGFAKQAWNIVTSNVTGKPTFADADKAKNALDQLNTRTMTSLTAEIPGRETNQMREQLAGMGVQPGSILQPDAMAFSKLTQTKQFIDSAITRQEGQLAEGGYSRSDRAKIRTNLGQLKQLQADYGTVLSHFGQAGIGADPAPGVGGTGAGAQGGPQFKILGVR